MQKIDAIHKHPSESSYLIIWTTGYEQNQVCLELLTTLSGFAHIIKSRLLSSGSEEYFWAERMK